jgi:Site-specific recombinase
VAALDADEAGREALRAELIHLLADTRAVHLYADSGVLGSDGFLAGLLRRIGERLLPPEPNPDRLLDRVRLLFWRDDDHRWLAAVPESSWLELMHRFELRHLRGSAELSRISEQVLDALEVIAVRVAALGVEPEVVRILPEVERYESPFLAQYAELRDFHERMLKSWGGDGERPQGRHLLVLLDQCTELLHRVRRRAPATGASASLNYILVRMEQNIERARRLLALLEPAPEVDRNRLRLRLTIGFVAAENRRHRLRDLTTTTLDLLSRRVTDHAGDAGELYITNTRREYFALFRSALGAGLLVALAAAVKQPLMTLHLAPLGQALIYSLNYIWCFVLMSALHWSLATKQPAMTANHIARALDVAEGRDRIERLADLVVSTLRSQFIALIGNFAVVIPVALMLGWGLARWTGAPLVSPAHAGHLLAEVDFFSPLTWFWGALTGVALFASGLVAGYYDNKAVYARIPERVVHLAPLRRRLSPAAAEALTTWLRRNLGAIAGSAFFGICLGSTGALGRVTGLPLDTVHVTFATANTVYAMVAVQGIDAGLIWRALGGIFVVGSMNLLVSFGLALWVALRAQRVRFRETRPLLRRLLWMLLRRPDRFFWPPADVAVDESSV